MSFVHLFLKKIFICPSDDDVNRKTLLLTSQSNRLHLVRPVRARLLSPNFLDIHPISASSPVCPLSASRCHIRIQYVWSTVVSRILSFRWGGIIRTVFHSEPPLCHRWSKLSDLLCKYYTVVVVNRLTTASSINTRFCYLLS